MLCFVVLSCVVLSNCQLEWERGEQRSGVWCLVSVVLRTSGPSEHYVGKYCTNYPKAKKRVSWRTRKQGSHVQLTHPSRTPWAQPWNPWPQKLPLSTVPRFHGRSIALVKGHVFCNVYSDLLSATNPISTSKEWHEA